MKQHWQSIYRHSLAVRITHWVNVICLLALLMSGLQIFNAHPALYWGNISRFGEPLVSMKAEAAPSGPPGITTVFGHRFDTTGWLGLSSGPYGGEAARGLPNTGTNSLSALPLATLLGDLSRFVAPSQNLGVSLISSSLARLQRR